MHKSLCALATLFIYQEQILLCVWFKAVIERDYSSKKQLFWERFSKKIEELYFSCFNPILTISKADKTTTTTTTTTREKNN